MDVTNLILYLKSQITSNSIDQQMVSKAIRLLELGAVFTAQSFAALPSPVGRSGELWLVLLDGLYFSTGELWIPMAQTSFGVIWSWGANTSGALGDNTVTNRSSPVSVVGSITDWCQISMGAFNNAAALRTNATAWSWGFNSTGQLGDNTTTSRSSPVSVGGGITDGREVSAGNPHAIARRSNGSAWAWGRNNYGQLGDNTTTNRSSPVSVVGGFFDWCQADAGGNHNVAVRTSGTAWAWGQNNCGQLGDGTTTNRSSPVSVVGGITDWCQVSGGTFITAALRTGGSLWSWGTNYTGHLGDSTTTARSSPVSVVGGFSDWSQVSAGNNHTVAVRLVSGSVRSAWAWGTNTCGKLGDSTTTNRSSPVSVVGGFSDWCQVSAGASSAALRTNGTVWAWGCASFGTLGDNSNIAKSSPVSVVGGFTDWCQISNGCNNIIALRSKTL